MSMNLKLDLPLTVNDMTDTETGKIFIALKKLVDDLNYILSHIGEDNLDANLRDKLGSLQKDIELMKGAELDATT